jgi:hypothetical protein
MRLLPQPSDQFAQGNAQFVSKSGQLGGLGYVCLSGHEAMIDDMQVNCTAKLCNANLNVTSCQDHYWLFATVRHLRVECRNSRRRVQTVSNALDQMDW